MHDPKLIHSLLAPRLSKGGTMTNCETMINNVDASCCCCCCFCRRCCWCCCCCFSVEARGCDRLCVRTGGWGGMLLLLLLVSLLSLLLLLMLLLLLLIYTAMSFVGVLLCSCEILTCSIICISERGCGRYVAEHGTPILAIA
ncbi:unnamed protein product [Polarella glacialis]|uniref:Uncharacterized protein n=1 Tax=Polarella glacialis TaxID=89957 RepID=A0A813LW27_POLGL|nr:unnamed protein product [Polarella glacialis]